MANPAAPSLEDKVLASLNQAHAPLGMDDLVNSVLTQDAQVRAVDVKIAALDLVSKGTVSLTETWQLQPQP
jgi:hypothetical protein